MITMESRIGRLISDFTESSGIEHFEEVSLWHLRDVFGCDGAYFATIGPRFVESTWPGFLRILADPQRYDPEQTKATEIVARFGPAFIDTEAYSPRERDRSLIVHEILRPAGISSLVMAAMQLAGRTTGVIHLLRSGRPFPADAVVNARPLLNAISILHNALVGLPVTMPFPPRSDAAPDVLVRLTPRESEVAVLASTGYRALQIAARLGMSVHTARRHLESIYRKCEIGSRVELAMLVARSRREQVATGVAEHARLRGGLQRILGSVELRPAVAAEAWESFG